MTDQELQAYLSKFGTLVYCRIATDYQGNSKGYAFASFSTEEENAASLGKYKINNLTSTNKTSFIFDYYVSNKLKYRVT